ncbi:VIR protein [Plasmodium vivax]|uniref:VIR protein n=1 Tax=Plasmodium vivax TaxID=5855 RepID=A0A1G4H0K5_PLAVI|nr:VIR protein [Plasmodium vivax]
MTSPLSDEELKSVLGNTISYKIYEKFDEADNSTNHNNHCSGLESIKKLDNENITSDCKKIARNLHTLDKLAKEVNYRDRCLHYKYWIYNKIFKLVNSGSNKVEDVIKYFLELQNHVFEKLGDYSCPFNFYRTNLHELNEFNEEKYLYEYFKYYHIIKDKISSDDIEKEKYNNYLTYIKKIYENHKDGYCCDYYGLIGDCYHYFICDRDYNPNNLLCKLKDDKRGSNCDLENLSESEKKKRDSEDSNFKEIKPYYFSCKEIKNEDDVPFLSCFVLRKGPRFSDQVTKKAPPESLDITGGYIKRAIEKIENGKCSEIPNTTTNNKFTNFNCTSTSDGQPRVNESDVKVKEESSNQNVQLEDTMSSSQEDSKLYFRWMIDEEVLGCSNNPSDKIRYRLCKHLSDMRSRGEIGKLQLPQVTQQDVKMSLPSQPLKASTQSNDFSCYPKGSEICKNFVKSFTSYSTEGIPSMESDHSKKSMSLQMDAENIDVTENEYNALPDSLDYAPEILEQTDSILNNRKFRMSVVASLIIGTLITFFIYYKFTGLGRWISTKIFGKKKINANLHNNVGEEFIRNPPEPMYINSKKKRARISYALM